MRLKLDGWKKVSSDGKHTVLSNPEGHQIKIAHNALSPKLRGQIASLKMADGGEVEDTQDLVDNIQDPDLARTVMKESVDPRDTDNKAMAKGGKVKSLRQRFAEGGSSSASDSPEQIASDAASQTPASPSPTPTVVINNTPTPMPSGGDQSASQQNSAPSAQQATDQSALQQNPASQASLPPAPPMQGPQAGPPPQFPTPTPLSPMAAQIQANKQDILGQSEAFKQDLQNGHITPETYGQLADKSTFGRLGTMFGLLAAGIGSGVTHQPNALLQMMDNEIQRDLDAQKTSKTNAQNLYNLTSQRIATEAQANATNVDTQAKTYALAKMDYNQLALHYLVDKVSNLHPGPERQNQEQALALLSSSLNTDNNQLADRVATLGMLSSIANPAGTNQNTSQSTVDPEVQFKAQNNFLRMTGHADLAQQHEERHIPNVPSIQGQLADRPIPQDTRNLINDQNILDQKGKDLLNYIQQHKGLDLNRWNPQDRAIARQKVEEMKNFYNSSIHGGALTEGRLSWYDEQFAKDPLDILPQLLGSTAKFKEVINSNAMRRDTTLKSLGFEPTSDNASQTSSNGIRYDKQGNAWRLGPNGKSVRVQ